MDALRVEDVSLSIGESGILDGVSFSLEKGSFSAMCGHNGAGKSQLLNEILKGAWAAVAQDIPLTISAVLLEDNAPNLGVLAGLAKPYDLTVRFVPAPADSGEQGPDEAAALEILRRSVKGLTPDGSGWRASGFKGRIEFGRSLWGAFGMEQGGVRYCVET